MNSIITIGCLIVIGVAVGLHSSAFDGVAAACAVYALMPWQPGRR